MKYLLAAIFLLALLSCSAHAEPAAALPFKRAVIREARWAFGLDAPVAVMAAQVQQESRWRPTVCSPFACGLAQFTPPTAQDMARKYPDRLGSGDVFNPEWAIRALTTYDRDLYRQFDGASECDRWAFALSAYNGGAGWLNRDRRQCDAIEGCDSARWWGNVARHSKRAGWALKENRGYPFVILKSQSTYKSWGRTVQCSLPSGPTS